jgi:hypothetical protein
MKTLRLFSAVLGLVAACALSAADSAKPASHTQVIFDHPENFTDVKDGSNPTDRGRDAILSTLSSFLVDRADRLLPEGYSLRITFTDIDLAGDFEPWHGPQFSDVRFVKSIYPPAFKFTYVVTDPSGRVVKQGAENIRDLTFQNRLTIDNSDPLRYEKDILDEWTRSNLRNLK